MYQIEKKQKRLVSEDYLFELILLILSCFHIVYGLFSVSMWIMLGLVFVLTLIRIHFKLSISGCIKFWWLFVVWSLVGVVYTNDIPYAIGYLLKLVVFVFSLSYLSRKEKDNRVYRILEIVVFIWVSTIILDVFFPSQIGYLRTRISTSSESWLANIDRAIALLGTKYGIFSDPAVSAFFSACGIGIGISFLVTKKKAIGWGWILFSSIALFMTNKRGPMLSVLISAGLLYLIGSFSSAEKKIRRIVVVVVVILLTVLLFLYSPLFGNWFDKINSNTYSNQSRMELYSTLYKNFLRHPLLGSGTKSSRALLNGTDGHNIYLAALSENGILGLLLLCISFVSGFKNTVMVLRKESHTADRRHYGLITFCLFMQFYIVFYGVTGNPMTTIYSLAMYFMCLGIPMRLHRIKEPQEYRLLAGDSIARTDLQVLRDSEKY